MRIFTETLYSLYCITLKKMFIMILELSQAFYDLVSLTSYVNVRSYFKLFFIPDRVLLPFRVTPRFVLGPQLTCSTKRHPHLSIGVVLPAPVCDTSICTIIQAF